MKMTMNQAVAQAEKGNWSRSFEIALQDDGIDKSITFFQWKEFAQSVISRRASEKNNMPDGYYS